MNQEYSDRNLIYRLAKIRAAQIHRAGKRAKMGEILRENPPQQPSILGAASPPRSDWMRFRPNLEWRRRHHKDAVTVESLRRCMIANLDNTKGWAVALREMLARCRCRAISDPTIEYSPPAITPMRKTDNRYRPVSAFDLEDRIVEGRFAAWLSRQIDPMFTESACAFRTSCSSRPSGTRATFEQFYEFQMRHRGERLWVAEFDIQSFYDTVQHSVVREQFELASPRIDPRWRGRAELLIGATLSAYSFPKNVLRDSSAALRERDPLGRYPWPEAALRDLHGCDPHSLDIGIPQGSALSGPISNLILRHADEAVEQVAGRHLGDTLFYRRYCDDMVLISRERSLAEDAAEAYKGALHELGLPIHPPSVTTGDTCHASIHNSKSRDPYPWDAGGIKRVGFLGYQIRHDGQVRIRPSSIRKHKGKITSEVARVQRDLQRAAEQGRSIDRSLRHIFRTTTCRIYSMATGRIKMEEQRHRCWIQAFEGLRGKHYSVQQISSLDRHMHRQLKKLLEEMKRLRPDLQINRNTRRNAGKKRRGRSLHPKLGFSYRAYLR